MSISFVRDDPEMTIVRHCHEASHIQIIVDGHYITEADSNEPDCGSMTMLWIPAGTVHRDRFKTRGGSFVSVSFSDEVLRALDGCSPPPEPRRMPSCNPMANAIVREMRAIDDFSALAVEGIALQLLAQIGRAWKSCDVRTSRLLRRVDEILNERFREKLSLQSVAADAGTSPRAVSHLLHQVYGSSLAGVIRNLRVHYATRCMAEKGLSLPQIALSSGFSDQAQFTKAFREVMGQTPAAFRRQL
jgi:AraC family transcriptional regulator